MAVEPIPNNERAVHAPKGKPWYKSKTVWLNVATVVAGGGPLVANFTGLVSPVTYAILLTFIGLANVALRFITTKGIDGVLANDPS